MKIEEKVHVSLPLTLETIALNPQLNTTGLVTEMLSELNKSINL
jgi:hypothetical protein